MANPESSSQELEKVLQRIDDTLDDSMHRLFELLRIESISTDPAYADQCLAAADWLKRDLDSIGLDASVHATPGHPMVVAKSSDKLASNPHTHFLFYGHYDVQPVDPLELWHSGPFEPAIEDTPNGRVIRGRGAADDKGQLMTFVEACRAWHHVTGKLPARITVFLEGEEESGSPSLVPFMEANRELLKADLAMVCDTGMWDAQTPAISTMLRGMVGEQITITAASRDLHSGMYGGPARNPIRVLANILAGLQDADGRITLPGFYDGVEELPAAIREQWANLEHDEASFLGDVDLSIPAGEPGYSVLEQIWARPSLDINGIEGGYTGDGFKTVLPSTAMAKLSFRLVGKQDPDRIRDTLYDYVRSQLPADCTVEFESKNGSAATVMEVDSQAFQQAHTALSTEWPKPAVYAGCGGSIPVVGHIKHVLDMDSMLIGFGLEDDAIHSPNEKYNVSSFHHGIRSWARVLQALS